MSGYGCFTFHLPFVKELPVSTHREIAGKTICVTGASSGIGQAIAEHLGAKGGHVFLAGRTQASLDESAARIVEAGGAAEVATFDVADSPALQDWIRSAGESTGRLDVLVNNAGFGDVGSTIADGDPDVWRSMLEVNVLALAVGCQAAIRSMRATGSEGNIINISSVAAIRRESGVYGATKHAVNCINSSLRQELEGDPIRVTSIMPGVFATNFSRHLDRAVIESMAESVGIERLDFDEQGRLPAAQLEQFQAAMAPVYGDPQYIADTVEHVLTLPIEINIEELVIRPQRSLF